jgi:ribulose-phosphate 3-epimerase
VKLRIAPSILAADFAHLADQIKAVETGGAHMLHVDVMDGHFVPNITIGPPVVRSVRAVTSLPLDVHLMVNEPDRFIESFVKAGSSILTVHVEAVKHLDRTIEFIRSYGVGVGVALNPATPISSIEHALDLVDMVLIMSVNPGFGGQKFIPYTIRKIQRLKEMIDARGLGTDIEVDGGINDETIGEVVGAGAEVIVAGSAIFGGADPGQRVKEMMEMAG